MRGLTTASASELVAELARELGRELPAERRDALCAYAELVAKWNAKINLTAADEPRALIEVLIADALVLADTSLLPSGARVLDVGTGAGAPIVPLLLLRPDLTALCVEPLGKRATFLRTAAAQLGLLSRMRVHEAKLDPQQPGALGQDFDVALSRATFAPETWLPLALALAPRALVLLASAAPPPPPAGSRLAHDAGYTLPFSRAPRRACAYLRV